VRYGVTDTEKATIFRAVDVENSLKRLRNSRGVRLLSER